MPAGAGGRPADDFATLFDFLPIGCYRSLPDGTQLRANPALVRLNGYDSEADLLAAVRDIAVEWYVDPGRRAVFRECMERDGHVTAFVSEIHRHRTRERIWISENAHVVRDAAGRVLFYEGTVEDITDRMRAEAALRDREQRWKLALEAVGDGVWDWNVATGNEVLSPQVLQMYGYPHGALPAHVSSLDSLTHPDDMEAMARDRLAHFEGRTPSYVNEHRILCADGSWKWVLSRGLVIERDAAGRPLRMIGTHTDITARKQAEALRRERDRAELARRTQSEFLARVSHELRTPLNAILGFTQLAELDPALPGHMRSWVGEVLRSGHHLLDLVDDLLDLSSVESGQLRFEIEPVPVADVVDDCWTMLASTARDFGVRFRRELPAEPQRVLADRTRLRQIMSNLMSNAVKYNRVGGHVTVRCRAADEHRLRLDVIDDGIGMTPEQTARLFRPFERAGAQHGRVAGTGLGLALSRQLAEAMGGSLAVESMPGRGSTFALELPAAD